MGAKGNIGAMLAMMVTGLDEGHVKPLTDKEVSKNKKDKRKKAKANIHKRNGVKEYYYGEEVIYARDQYNADRKAKNKGLI